MAAERCGSWGSRIACALVMLALSCPLSAAAGEKVSLASPNAPEQIHVRAGYLLAKRVAEKTNGGLTIEILHSGQLGGMKENFEAIMAGNLEMAQVNNAFLANLYPNTMLFDLPFIFRDNDHMRRVVRGPIGQQVYADFEKKTGIRIIMAGLADGPRSVFNRRRPVKSPEDLKGIKLRVMQSPLMMDTFQALGAIPTPMPFPDLYMAAKQGVIDGAETPPFGIAELKAWEISKYYSLTKHFAMPSAFAMNVKWFEKLPPAYQKAILEAADEARAWHDAQFDAENTEAMAEMKRHGMEVNDVADIRLFRDAVKPVYDKYAGQVGGWPMIQAVLDTK